MTTDTTTEPEATEAGDLDTDADAGEDQAPTTGAEAAESTQSDETPDPDQTTHLERIAALEADLEAARADLTAANADLEAARAELLRWQVGAAAGLPENLIGRLKGDTRDDLEADARALIAAVRPTGPAGGPPRELLPGWVNPSHPPTPSADPIRDQLRRIGANGA
jgi:hypothetical protein